MEAGEDGEIGWVGVGGGVGTAPLVALYGKQREFPVSC